jgi:hypothetical protein
VNAGIIVSLIVFLLLAIAFKAGLPVLWFHLLEASVPGTEKTAWLAGLPAAFWLKPVAYGGAGLVTGFVFARLGKAQSLAEAAVFSFVLALLCAVEGADLAQSAIMGVVVFALTTLGAWRGLAGRRANS